MDIASLGIIPVVVVGACVGSFLNVVIYRLPIGLSISHPKWSFCPHCEKPIPPQCNLPVIGWLLLGGRCRDCRNPISMMYPVVEAATALIFVLIWDAVLVARVFPGGGTLSLDWPLLICSLFLFAGLLASAAMDIETYTIHIQIPLLTIGLAAICHSIRGLPGGRNGGGSVSTVVLPPAICAVGLAMGAGWLLSCLFRKHRMPDGGEVTLAAEANSLSTAPATGEVPPGGSSISGSLGFETLSQETHGQESNKAWRFQPLPVLAVSAIVLALAAWQTLAPDAGLKIAIPPAGQRALVGIAVLLLILILSSLENRDSDAQIMEDLERERPLARGMASGEFLSLLPAILCGFAVLAWFRYTGYVGITWSAVLGLPALQAGWAVHAAGGFSALSGAIWAAALGWGIRILGTLAFGKEAFGSGDIYIMAAIGAVGGLWLVVIGFLLSAILALVGVLATSFKKTSRAIPFGPWLALGAFVSLWLLGPIASFFGPLGWFLWALVSGQPAHGLGD